MTQNIRIENAVIDATMLGHEGHGILTCYITVAGRGFGGSFGGYCFDSYDESAKKRIASGFGMEFVRRVLDTIGVTEWEKLKGKHCRIKTTGIGGRIEAIGHIIEDRWFDPAELVKEYDKP